MKLDLIRGYLANGELPELHKEKDYTIQEYMKLKQDSLIRLADALKENKE